MAPGNHVLERAISIRRSPPAGDSADDEGGDAGDDSKTRKPVFSVFRVTKYLIRTGYLWPILVIVLVVVIIATVIVRTQDVMCISSTYSDHSSRLKFFGFNKPESDFSSLGVPWCRSKHGKTVEWTSKDLLLGLEEFVPIYENRPIKDNIHGMGFDHSFGLWFITRWLKPDLMIESTVFVGHSTWVLRQAMPGVPIVSLAHHIPTINLEKGPVNVDGNCTYFVGNDFMDFGSMDWERVMAQHQIKDLSRALVFFDDHQNELKRLKQALKAGFKHLVFEDNYDTGTGDNYSFRQICDQFYIKGGGHSCFRDSDEARIRYRRKKFWDNAVDVEELCGPGEAWWGVRGQMRDNFNHINTAISYAEHLANSRFVESVLDVYWEVPPVAGPSLTHQTRYDPARAVPPLIADGKHGLFRRLNLSNCDTSVFNSYTQMVYLQVSGHET